MISVIIVDYNSIKKTMEYIDNLIKKVSDYKCLNFIIIDNSCNDENFKLLNSIDKITEYDKLKIDESYKKIDIYDCLEEIKVYKYNEIKILAVKSRKNLGYAKGNNLGAILSEKIYKDNYYIFSNNDLRIRKDINVSDLIAPFDADKNIAIVGPKIIGMNQEPQSPRKKISIWKQIIIRYWNCIMLERMNRYTSDIDYDNKSKYAYWVLGCFFIADAKKFHEAKMFDKNTFLYCEEMILSERLMKYGYKVFFYNDIELIHEHGATIKNTFNFIKSEEVLYKSYLYYYCRYMKCGQISIIISKISFIIFKAIYPIKTKVKRFIK